MRSAAMHLPFSTVVVHRINYERFVVSDWGLHHWSDRIYSQIHAGGRGRPPHKSLTDLNLYLIRLQTAIHLSNKRSPVLVWAAGVRSLFGFCE
ncbi:hypothetical protein [Fischerella sp. PCC 9605]|uniref:hypothetical protein n=1 Tax=Fischerella sp. PCC 9605 TaxID=1173024 RepID=UPI0018CC1EF8